jgi:hypothetical protein
MDATVKKEIPTLQTGMYAESHRLASLFTAFLGGFKKIMG